MTPPINSEISKKLRAAIRAKLEELGVYVDDELPDYIMVMIANKKEKKQMKDDLTLFLSKNTDAFVEWLFDICHRLQSAPAAAPAAESKAAKEVKKEKEKTVVKKKVVEGFTVKKEKLDEKAKKKAASEAEKEKERERQRKEKREAERREIERANREDRERREREEREKRDREERREREGREERDRKERERERKEREQRDREREEERQKEKEREKRREREREERDTPPTKRRHSPIRSRRALSPDAPVPSAAVRRRVEERSPERRRETVASSITRAASPPPVSVQSKVVVKRQVKPQNDKAGAKGASSMFLRAMNAASVSAGYGGGPVSRKRAAPTANADLPQFSDEEEFANGDVEEEEEEEKEKEVDVVPRKKAVPAARRTVQPPVEKKEPRFIVTFNKKEEEGGKRRAVKRGAKDEKEEEDEGAVRVSSAPRKTITVSGEKRRRETSVPKEDEEEERSRKRRMSISVSPPQKHSSPSDWDGHINLNDDETSDEEAAIDAMLAATRASRVSSRGGETERLPPTSHLSRGNSYYEPYDPSQPAVSAVHIAPQAYVPTPLAHSMARAANPNKIQERCKFFPNCKEGEACIYLHPATRHCTNFPRCSFGSRCLYTHPKCKFDAKCNNPTCPFTHTVQKKAVAVVAPRQTMPVVPVAAPTAVPLETAAPAAVVEKTTKIEPDVPLVPAPVATIRTRVPSTLQSSIPCRFAAGCTNPVCAFQHPKECRFGQNCRNYNCFFYHPPAGRVSTAAVAAPVAAFASPSKLKWRAAAAPAKTETV